MSANTKLRLTVKRPAEQEPPPLEPPAKRRFMRLQTTLTDMLLVKVNFKGKSEKPETFAVEYSLLALRSPSVAKHRLRTSQQGWPTTDPYIIESCRPATFELYLEIISGEKSASDLWSFVFSHPDFRFDEVDDPETEAVCALVEAWFLGYGLGDLRFCDEVMMVLLEQEGKVSDIPSCLMNFVEGQVPYYLCAADHLIFKWIVDNMVNIERLWYNLCVGGQTKSNRIVSEALYKLFDERASGKRPEKPSMATKNVYPFQHV